MQVKIAVNYLITSVTTVTEFFHVRFSYAYDAAGNMIQDGQLSLTGHLYSYDAEGQLGNVGVTLGSPTATYTYDGNGSRVRKDYNGTYTEYIFVGGNVLAQHNADGTWSDNIYAQGKRIARSDSYDRRVDVHGTYAQTGVEAATNFSQLNGYTIQSGDHLYWRQYNSGANGGLNLIAGGFQTSGIVKDTNGVYINDATTQGSWVEREVDLTSYAGVTLTNAQLVTDTSTSPGTWDIYFADISLVHPDGTVIAVYNRGTSFAIGGYVTPSGVTNQATTVKTASLTADGANPTETTTYYISDQIGSSRMDIAYGSWPTWWGAFDPYGAEIDTNVTTNNYKFSGMERDAQTGESGLDNFGARSYSSNLVGKFMQPDPAGLASVNLWNSLSFYRYGYVLENPLSLIDPTGLDCVYFNDSGTGVESVDPDDNEGNPSGECSDNGGDYVNGQLTGANYFASSDSWTLNSASGSNTYTLYASAPGTQSDGTTCSGSCAYGYAQNSFSPIFASTPYYNKSIAGAPNNAPTNPRATQCKIKVGVGIGLDVAGTAAGLVPGAGAALVTTQVSLGLASAAYSAYNGSAAFTIGNATGAQLSAVAAGAEYVGWKTAAKALPWIGTLYNAGALAYDVYHAQSDYQACLAGG